MAAVTLGPVLLGVRERLADDGVVPRPELVSIVARRELPLPHLNGDKDIVLRLKRLAVPQEIVQGAGRLSRLYRELEVVLRIRDARDKIGSDEIWLIDAFLAFELAVLDSLQMFQPEDATTGAVLLGEPMRLLQTTDPDRELETQGKAQGWGSSVMQWQLMFEPDLAHTTRQ